jgi:class 3 adenylate cyclase
MTDTQVFYASLLDILEDKALTVIFANIEDLLLTATSFLSELEQRQKACRLYVDVIGDILEEHMGRMRVYMVSRTRLSHVPHFHLGNGNTDACKVQE